MSEKLDLLPKEKAAMSNNLNPISEYLHLTNLIKGYSTRCNVSVLL